MPYHRKKILIIATPYTVAETIEMAGVWEHGKAAVQCAESSLRRMREIVGSYLFALMSTERLLINLRAVNPAWTVELTDSSLLAHWAQGGEVLTFVIALTKGSHG